MKTTYGGDEWHWTDGNGIDIHHALLGQDFGGGMAYVSSVCRPDSGFGFSSRLRCNIANISAECAWDLYIISHEIGWVVSSLLCVVVLIVSLNLCLSWEKGIALAPSTATTILVTIPSLIRVAWISAQMNCKKKCNHENDVSLSFNNSSHNRIFYRRPLKGSATIMSYCNQCTGNGKIIFEKPQQQSKACTIVIESQVCSVSLVSHHLFFHFQLTM